MIKTINKATQVKVFELTGEDKKKRVFRFISDKVKFVLNKKEYTAEALLSGEEKDAEDLLDQLVEQQSSLIQELSRPELEALASEKPSGDEIASLMARNQELEEELKSLKGGSK